MRGLSRASNIGGPVAALILATPVGASRIDPDADAAVRDMCAALDGFAAFTVTSDASTEVILRDGRKLLLVAATTAVVDRAKGFRLRRQGAFGATEAVHDGATLTIWSEALGGYAAESAPDGVDEDLDDLLAAFGAARRTTRRVVRRTTVHVAALPAGCSATLINGVSHHRCGSVCHEPYGAKYVIVEVQ